WTPSSKKGRRREAHNRPAHPEVAATLHRLMRRYALLLLVPIALLAASCGGGKSGGGSVSKDDAAVVDGTPIPRSELDSRLGQAQCSYKLQKRTFPSAGSPEYLAIEQQI